ncbi:reverse transcriptase-like protein [Caldalkalibacillus salinus]|uniref:reverse transcriptase-like protein n=1 Tax=Caldalkalibacillus salinus TaxID=2803787 RepID=UPI001924F797|nr:reverse transcriptase-like protein [Caldalkalibacillus salinus]
MIKVYIDGASAGNPGPSGAGIFIKKEDGSVERLTIPLGSMSNHEAELHALLKALEHCKAEGYNQVLFHTDSQLVEQAVDKRFAKKDAYDTLLKQALTYIDRLDLFFLKWIQSKDNPADPLSREAIQMNEQKGR